MVNPSKAKGTTYETAVVQALKPHFPNATRHAQHGNHDIGDINGIPQATIETKNCKTMNLAQWIDETITEATNAGQPHAILIHKRRGQNTARSYVTMELQDWAAMYAHYQQLRHQHARHTTMTAYDEETGPSGLGARLAK